MTTSSAPPPGADPQTMSSANAAADAAGRPRRDVTLVQLIFLGIGGQIGSAWLFAVLSAAGVAGPAAILSWLLAGVVFMVIALTWIELGSALPMTGTVVRYPYMTHGAFTGWIMGWAAWLFAVSIPAVEAVAAMTYLGSRFPHLHLVGVAGDATVLTWPAGILAAIAMMAVFFVVNIAGIKRFSEATNWITIWKIAVPVVTFLLLFFVLRSKNFDSVGGFAPHGPTSVVHAISSTGIAFAFVGFRQALDFGGEMKNPQRNARIAVFVAIIVPTVLYTLLQIAFIGAVDWNSAGIHAGDWAALTTSPWASGPFFHALNAAGTAGFVAFGNVLLVDAVLSPAGAGWIYLGNSARVSRALALHGAAPAAFHRLSRRGIPLIATAASFVVGCLFFIPAPSWYSLVSFISAAGVLTFLMGSASLSSLRRTAADLHRPFRLHAAWFWSPASFVCSVLVIYWAGFTTLVTLLTTVFSGLPIFALYTARRRGWVRTAVAWPLSAAFLAAWIWVNAAGGWFLDTSNAPHHGWNFAVYAPAFAACLAGFSGALWVAGTREARRHINRGLWLLALMVGLFIVSYYGAYGPEKHPSIPFPRDVVVVTALSLLAYFWSVASGFRTPDLESALAAAADSATTRSPSEIHPVSAATGTTTGSVPAGDFDFG